MSLPQRFNFTDIQPSPTNFNFEGIEEKKRDEDIIKLIDIASLPKARVPIFEDSPILSQIFSGISEGATLGFVTGGEEPKTTVEKVVRVGSEIVGTTIPFILTGGALTAAGKAVSIIPKLAVVSKTLAPTTKLAHIARGGIEGAIIGGIEKDGSAIDSAIGFMIFGAAFEGISLSVRKLILNRTKNAMGKKLTKQFNDQLDKGQINLAFMNEINRIGTKEAAKIKTVELLPPASARFISTKEGLVVRREELSAIRKVESDIKVQANNSYKVLKDEKFNSGNIPKYARSVNTERQNVPDNFKQFEIEVAKIRPKRVQTWAQTAEKRDEILGDPKELSKVFSKAELGQALNTAEIDATRQVNIDAIGKMKEIAEKGTLEQFNVAFSNYDKNIFTPLSNASSEAGRALNIHKRIVSPTRLSKAFSKLGRGLNEREMEEFKKLNLEDAVEVKQFIGRIGDPRLRDYMYEFWYNSILSGIPTHIVNVTSNTGWALYQIPHRGLAGAVDKLVSTFTGKQRVRFVSEMVPLFGGYRTGFFKGMKGAGEVIRTNRVANFETKWSLDIGNRALSAFETSPYKPLRQVAPFISMPTRSLRAMDIWANSMAFDGQIAALSRRQGLQLGLSGKKLKIFENNLKKNPSEPMIQDAMDFARNNTFMNEPGKFTQWIIRGRDVVPGGRFVIPFVNTISNLFQRGIELTPVLGLTLARGKPAAEVIAKQIEGSILGLYMLHKANLGEVTGAAPDNVAEREAFFRQGKVPWAIRMGDRWVQYRRIEPFNTVLASTVIAHDAIKNAKDDESAARIFGDMIGGITENLMDSSYLNGLTRLIDRHGSRAGIFQRHLSSFVPYSSFWRSINRSYEVATKGQAKLRETKSLLGAFSQTIPGVSDKIPARMNVWGEEIILPGGVLRQWLPFKFSDITGDPLEEELERLTIYPGMPGKNVTIRGKKVEFDRTFYRNYLFSFGKEAKDRLLETINSESYKRNDDDRRRTILNRVLSRVRKRKLREAKRRFK